MKQPPTTKPRRSTRRRATGYVLVITTAMLLSVIGFAAVISARTTVRMVVGSNSWAEAGALASSAVECALAQIRDTPDWRDQFLSGVANPDIVTAMGTMTYVVVDEDGDLTDDIQDNVRVYGIGRVGDATRVCAVTLQPAGRQGLEVLRTALHADGNMTVNSSDPFAVSGGPLSCNARTTVNGPIDGDVETVLLTNNDTITGTTTVPADVKDMPSADVFDAYAAEATVIPHPGQWNWKLKEVVLSPVSNPFGTPNPGGVYLITVPPGSWMPVQDVRVWGTLLVRLEGGSDLELKTVIMDAFQANHPVLIVDCEAPGSTLWIKFGATPISESFVNMNFNPLGIPLDGIADDDLNDVYTPRINGLVHVIRQPGDTSSITDIDVTSPVVGPLVVDGRVNIDDLAISADPDLYYDPPPGYALPTHMAVYPGSWQWESLPITGVTGL